MRRHADKFAVAQAAFARGVHHPTFFGGAIFGADFPLLGRCRDQQRPRRGTGHTQAIVLQRNAGAAARGEDFPDRVNVGFEERIFRGDHLHGHRIDIEFLGHTRGQRGMRTGAGIVLVHHQFHRAVGQHAHPGIGFEFAGRCRSLRVGRRHPARQIQGYRQTGSDRDRLFEKHPARQLGTAILEKAHQASFGAVAARLMALLMRP